MYEQLTQIIADVEQGRFPAADAGVTVVGQPPPRDAAVLAFTAHSVVAADVEPEWVTRVLPDGDLSAPLCPPFLGALTVRLGRRVSNIDLVCLAEPLPAGAAAESGLELQELTGSSHPRVLRSRRHRDDVAVWGTAGGWVSVGRGLAGRYEVTVEVDENHRGLGLGRRLAAAGRALAGTERPVWAQITPGNAASVRAFLAAGYRPVGAEALLVPE
ncbi:MAG: GNAT family N-acetyltransferase [Streptosporangiales bacterium]|nr:GNAT family N-acetyltransferase [Streptosporangiales bacterium]